MGVGLLTEELEGVADAEGAVAGLSFAGLGGGGTPVDCRAAGESLFRAGLGCSSRMGIGDGGMTLGGANKLRRARIQSRLAAGSFDPVLFSHLFDARRDAGAGGWAMRKLVRRW